MTKTEPKLTPMMKQWHDIKNNNQDKIIFFRLGDFYEMFYDDAIEASKILQITLTKTTQNAMIQAFRIIIFSNGKKNLDQEQSLIEISLTRCLLTS